MSNDGSRQSGSVVSLYVRVDLGIQCACLDNRVLRVMMSSVRGKNEEIVSCPFCGHSYAIVWDRDARIIVTEHGNQHELEEVES